MHQSAAHFDGRRLFTRGNYLENLASIEVIDTFELHMLRGTKSVLVARFVFRMAYLATPGPGGVTMS